MKHPPPSASQVALVQEHAELMRRIDDLEAWLAAGDTLDVEPHEQARQRAKLAAMRSQAERLAERIAALEP